MRRPDVARSSWFVIGLGLACVVSAAACKTPSGAGLQISHLYTDLDGTLLNKDSQVPAEAKKALERFRAAGGNLGVATGRTPDLLPEILPHVPVNLPVITANGALITDPQGKLIRMLVIRDPESVVALCAPILAGSCKYVYTAYGNPKTGETKKADGVCQPEPDPAWGVMKLRGRDCADVPGLVSTVTKVSAGRFAVVESGHGVYYGISVAAGGVGKDAALRFISERLGVPLAKMAFIGDSGNDVSAVKMMLDEGGKCFAMSNGTKELLEACPQHTKRTNNQSGVVEVIDSLLGVQP
jgi:hydroxymethylpyrimidine pyrophosphatase-like HAD family hydrolase